MMIINKCQIWKRNHVLGKILQIIDFVNMMIKISQLNPKKRDVNAC